MQVFQKMFQVKKNNKKKMFMVPNMKRMDIIMRIKVYLPLQMNFDSKENGGR